MRRRISLWFSEGFIYYLGQVEEEKLKRAVMQPYTTTSQRDNQLIRAIAEKGDIIQHHIMDNCPAEGMVSELPHLGAACKDWVEQGLSGSEVQVYNETTCFEFHQLLVATLLAYGKGLDALYAAKDAQTQVCLARRVWHCATILWRIAHSGILHHHLRVLNKKSWLTVPSYDKGNIWMFQKFSGFDHGAYPMKHPTAEGRLGEIDDEREFSSMRTSYVNDALIFQKWLHIQVGDLEALSILSNYATILDSPIQINLLAEKRPRRDPCFYGGAKWVHTVKTLIDERAPTLRNGKRINADAVIDYLRSKIVTAQQAKCFHTIFHKFNNENLSWRASVHCEAAIASLVKSIDHVMVEPGYHRRSIKVPFTFCDHDALSDVCIGIEPRHNRHVDTMLSNLLGAPRYHKRAGHRFHSLWPLYYPFSGTTAILGPSRCIGGNAGSIQATSTGSNYCHDEKAG